MAEQVELSVGMFADEVTIFLDMVNERVCWVKFVLGVSGVDCDGTACTVQPLYEAGSPDRVLFIVYCWEYRDYHALDTWLVEGAET